MRRHPPLDDLVENLDGLVLQGGVDIAPQLYGAEPWTHSADNDPLRDRYEMELLRGFIHAGKPVLGICRGAQLLNVFFGGTLVQDIPTQWPNAIAHQDLDSYDQLTHEVRFLQGSLFEQLYGSQPQRVTSLHHQCVDRLGQGLMIEALSPIDGVPEAIRHPDMPFVVGVQWHPEFHPGGRDTARSILDSGPLMMAFLKAAVRRAGRLRRLASGVTHIRERASSTLRWRQ
ncbi:MAG: gamma-glutamyl-gamma-aminobutyrate hydrolase family protein, partial [Brachymonas sp.]|nr:gamma-glutamyl-gamma-aminobutyrate hydrolase family protein [Brachymonas sp.]